MPIQDIDEGRTTMAKEVVRIKLKSYDHRVLDNAAAKIVATVTIRNRQCISH